MAVERLDGMKGNLHTPVEERPLTDEETAEAQRNEQLSRMDIIKDDGKYYYVDPDHTKGHVEMKDENGNAVTDSVTALRVAPKYTSNPGTPMPIANG